LRRGANRFNLDERGDPAMSDTNIEHGEIHCLLCGRYLADICHGADGSLRLLRAPHGEQPQTMVKLVGGRLHCARCGGRAFVEWDLVATIRPAA
jgi:hypothetical protein